MDISIHALQAESDDLLKIGFFMQTNFNPRSPSGERLWVVFQVVILIQFQSTLSKRRATERFLVCVFMFIISIHALQAESDGDLFLQAYPHKYISIHALQAESDGAIIAGLVLLYQFQSTLSKRRATTMQSQQMQMVTDFNPRSPSGERQQKYAFSSRIILKITYLL